MNKIDRIKIDLDKTITNESKLQFPSFVRKLRESICITRCTMARDLKVHQIRLFHLEQGNYRRALCPKLITKIADYFGVQKELMFRKAGEFKPKGRNG